MANLVTVDLKMYSNLLDKLERYEIALNFYAEEGTWEDGEYEGGIWFSVAERDKGEKARKGLIVGTQLGKIDY